MVRADAYFSRWVGPDPSWGLRAQPLEDERIGVTSRGSTIRVAVTTAKNVVTAAPVDSLLDACIGTPGVVVKHDAWLCRSFVRSCGARGQGAQAEHGDNGDEQSHALPQ
jgi:hypothetical protein